MKRHNIFPIIILTAMLSACASVGREFDSSKLNQLQSGTSTIMDANRLLGKPTAMSTNSDGSQVLGWHYAKSSLGGAKSEVVSIIFDSSGKMVRVAGYSNSEMN